VSHKVKKCSADRVNRKSLFVGSAFPPASSLGRRANSAYFVIGEPPALSLRSTILAPSHSGLGAKPLNHRLPPSNYSPYQPSPAGCLTRQPPTMPFPLSRLSNLPSTRHASLAFFCAWPNSIRASHNSSPLRPYKIIFCLLGEAETAINMSQVKFISVIASAASTLLCQSGK